jgi:hypothetical protein
MQLGQYVEYIKQSPDFQRKIFRNMQVGVTFNYVDLHSLVELLSSLKLHACFISSTFVGDIVLWLFNLMLF